MEFETANKSVDIVRMDFILMKKTFINFGNIYFFIRAFAANFYYKYINEIFWDIARPVLMCYSYIGS